MERIDAEDESFAELAYATGDDDDFIMPHLRRRAELCALHGFWLDKKRRAGNRLPGRHSIKPAELELWLGWINLVEVAAGRRDYVFRLYGNKVAREFGRDLTGRSMSELPPEHVGIVTAPFPRVIRHRLPCATRHLIHLAGRRFVREPRLPLDRPLPRPPRQRRRLQTPVAASVIFFRDAA